MRLSASGHHHPRTHVLLLLAGVLSLLLMPVDYRGGAAVSHPHATVQLIADLTAGSLDHHVPTQPQHPHPAPVWSPLGPLSDGLGPPVAATMATAQAPLGITAASVAGLSRLASESLTPGLATESVTPWSTTTGKYLLYALVLPTVMLLAWHLSQGRLERRTSQFWRDVTSQPEPPPPRPYRFDRSR